MCLLAFFFSDIAFWLLKKAILDRLEIRFKKKKSPFSEYVQNLGVETAGLNVTPGPEASQARAGSSFVKNEKKMQKTRKTDHKLDNVPHYPRPDGGVTSLWCRKLLRVGVL